MFPVGGAVAGLDGLAHAASVQPLALRFMQQRPSVPNVGEEVVINAPLGTRRYDIVVRDSSGKLQGIEIKTGSAKNTLYQEFTDMFVNKFGAQGTGEIAKEEIESSITIYLN